MVGAIKPNMIAAAEALLKKNVSPPADGANFGDFLKTDMKDFLTKSHQVEGLMSNYVNGIGDIEEVAPKFKELMLEFEVKTKIIASLANVIKTLNEYLTLDLRTRSKLALYMVLIKIRLWRFIHD
jgi:hypothetical protein